MKKSQVVPIESKSLENLGEYADAESISPSTELLVEFLYSVMVKDYEKALEYCTQILSQDPDYVTMKEFRPLIEEKLRMIRNEELEDSSSDSSSSGWSHSSDSSDNLEGVKNESCWEGESSNCSSLESDDESDDVLAAEDSIKSSKAINASATRTILRTKLPPYKTQTRVLRRGSTANDQNKEFSSLKSANPSTLPQPTDTRVLSQINSLSPTKDDNSRTFAWFTSLQENIFRGRRRENAKTESLVRNTKEKEAQ